MRKSLVIASIAIILTASAPMLNAGPNRNFTNSLKPCQSSQIGGQNDTFLDFVVATGYDNAKLMEFLGVGNGGFSLFKNYSYGSYGVRDFITEDFNKDGFLDFAIPCFVWQPLTFHFTVLLGNGSGQFSEPVNYTATTYPYDITAGDFNEDGNLDIALLEMYGNATSIIEIYYGDGQGSFTFERRITLPMQMQYSWKIVSADLNNDNHLDLAIISCWQNEYLSILIGDGTGNFTVKTSYLLGHGYQYTSIDICDFNGDGYPDLAIPVMNDFKLTICYNDGTGNFSNMSSIYFPVGDDWPLSCVHGDFNEDGLPDLAVTACHYVFILINNGSGGFKPQVNYSKGLSAAYDNIVARDFTGDDHLDLLMTCANNHTVTFYKGNGDGTFGGREDMYAGDYPVALVCGNFNPAFPPKIKCNGVLHWSNVKPGSTLTGTFTVQNVGEPRSLLNWEVVSWPSWGTWTFTPNSGTNLTKGDSTIVTVNVIAPPDKKKIFNGTIRVIDIDNSSDFCELPVTLSTPLNQSLHGQSFFEWFFERFPRAFPILRHILGYNYFY
jgi:hypothetical protein